MNLIDMNKLQKEINLYVILLNEPIMNFALVFSTLLFLYLSDVKFENKNLEYGSLNNH